MRTSRILLILSILTVLLGAQSSRAQIRELGNGEPGAVKAPHLSAELISDSGTITPGATTRVALALTLEPGWHVYWVNAGDSGQPPEVKWVLPKDTTVGPMQYAAPTRLPLGPLLDYGYLGMAIFPFSLSAAPELGIEETKLTAHVQWLVCREVCLPGKAYLGLTLKAVSTASPETNKLIQAAVDAEPVKTPESVRIGASATRENLVLDVVTGHKEASAEFFPLDDDSIRNAADQRIEPTPDGLRLTVERADVSDTLPHGLKGVLRLSEGRSYNFDVPVGALAKRAAGRNSEPGLAFAILLAFAGGIILNLMPCVFPVLFLKALAFVEGAGEGTARQRKHAAVYTLGILCSFWSIVAVLLILRALGKQAGWGFQLQSPGFVIGMIFLLFFMALSLAGMFDVGLSLTSAGDSLTRKSGYTGSFFTGVLATVVATPCTAPLMGAAIGFALAQSAWVTFAVFTALAVGLALPYILLTLVPGWANRLPRPGKWMETLKQVSSIPLFLTVVWLIWVYGRLNGADVGDSTDHIAKLLISLVILAVAGWILGRWPARLGAVLAAAMVVVAALAIPLSAATEDHLKWQPFSDAALREAQSHGHPVFVDFTAAWCLSCQVNEKAVLHDSAVEQELQLQHYVLLRADWTRYDAEITNALGRVGRSGVPTYVVFKGNETAEPHVLPELLTRTVVLDALR